MCGFRWMVLGVAALLWGASPAFAALQVERVDVDVKYAEAFEKGVAAFRRGDLTEAAKTFHEAYLIRPTSPKLLSWLALIRDEQTRREVMGRALDDVKRHPPVQEPGPANELATSEEGTTSEPNAMKPPAEPFWRRLSLTPHVGQELEQTVTPLQETRPEILTEVKRAGFHPLYKEGIGFQPIRGLGFSGRTEIFEEPIPVEALILDSKVLNFSELSQFHRSILPLFTRSAAGRVVMDYEPLPRLTYEYDAREILHQYQTKFNFKDIELQTHAFNALYSFPRIPLLGTLTINPWYKRVLQRSTEDVGSYENRNELIANFSLRPSETMEYFFQFGGYSADKTRMIGSSKLRLYQGQLRLSFPTLRLFAIPSFEYSITDFGPSGDQFTKRDMFVDWGMDLTKRLRASSKEQLILTELSQATQIPSNPSTQVFNTLNTLSYELFKDFDVSLGLDHSRGMGYSNFNNIGLRAEMELFKPGLIRSKLGYEWVSYYNISDSLSLLYWRFFLFQ